jgi:hypothetical protein
MAGPVCNVIISNQTPSDWNVTIVGASVDFTYRDGSSSNSTNASANLGSGQSTTLSSNANCVGNQHVVLRVLVDGNTQLFDRQYPTPAGRCATENRVVLAPAAAMASHKGKATSAEMLNLSVEQKDKTQ